MSRVFLQLPFDAEGMTFEAVISRLDIDPSEIDAEHGVRRIEGSEVTHVVAVDRAVAARVRARTRRRDPDDHGPRVGLVH